jgi:hypothetical protein
MIALIIGGDIESVKRFMQIAINFIIIKEKFMVINNDEIIKEFLVRLTTPTRITFQTLFITMT